MIVYQYFCKFYLNASHFIYINDKKGDIHSHCFEIAIDIASKDRGSFVSFSEIENCIKNLLSPYQEQVINTIPPFDKINPTLEEMAKYFKDLFYKELNERNWTLLTLEFSETPTRSFLINVTEENN